MSETLSDALASLAFANRNPSWSEYAKSSPCDQRAIEKRWFAIAHEPRAYDWKSQNGFTPHPADQAWYNWQRAMFGTPMQTTDDEPRGFNDEQNWEGRQTGSMKAHEWGE